MTDLNNKLNMNVRSAYSAQSFKGGEEVKPEEKGAKEEAPKAETAKATDAYGRAFVEKSNKPLPAETIEGIKKSMLSFQGHPALVKSAVNTVDHAVDMGVAYEEACCGACDAVEARLNK